MTEKDLQQIETLLDAKLDAKLAPVFERLDGIDNRIKNLEKLQEETHLALGAVEGRLQSVQGAVNRVASKVGVPGVPAIGGVGLPRAAKSS